MSKSKGMIISSDGEYMYIKRSAASGVTKREIKEQKILSTFQDNPLLIWDKLLKEYEHKVIKQENALYKIELSPKIKFKQQNGSIELLVDSEKGTVIEMVTYNKGVKSVMEIKDYFKYNSIYFPIKMHNEVNLNRGKMVSDIIWKDVKINKGISDKEFVLQ